MRKLLFPLLLLLGVIFLIGHFAEFGNLVGTLKHANPWVLLLALGVQALWYVNAGLNLWWIYRTLGIPESPGRLALLNLAASFAGVVAPSGGMSGMAVYVAEAQRRRYSVALVTVGSILYFLSEYVGFLAVLALGIVVFIRRNTLHSTEIVASSLMGLLALGLAALLYVGMRSAEQLSRILGWLVRGINAMLYPLLRRPYLSEERASRLVLEAGEGLRTLHAQPRALLPSLALGLSSKALLLLVLLLSFRAYQVPYSPGTIVGGFCIAYLFLIISPTPAGIGVVEGLLAVGLNSLHVPLGQAAVVALTYRALTFWLPLLLGPLAYRLLDFLPLPSSPENG